MCSLSFDGMEALVCMAVAVLVVVLVDSLMFVQARRHS
jgi:hypothetical protein